jgi:molybdopterin-guanine dinucleotide biosynthesis protein A
MQSVGGQSILARVVARLSPQCDGLILNANGDPSRFAGLNLPVVADAVAGFPGPLAGILAGLDWVAANRPGALWMLSAASDCPFLPRDLVNRLDCARRVENAPLAVAVSGGQSHHVIALWSLALRQPLRDAVVNEGCRAVGRWMARYPVAIAEWPVEPFDPFFNANTPDDLAKADRLAHRFDALS